MKLNHHQIYLFIYLLKIHILSKINVMKILAAEINVLLVLSVKM